MTQNNFAAARPISAGFPAERPAALAHQRHGFYYWPEDSKTSTMYEWNFNVQRELPGPSGNDRRVCGWKGHLCRCGRPEHQSGKTRPGAVVSRRPYPNLSDAIGVVPWGNSSYNSMQTTVERRMGAIRITGAWTWSHSIDNTSGESSNSPIQNSFNLAAQRASSTFDIRHKLAISGTYDCHSVAAGVLQARFRDLWTRSSVVGRSTTSLLC